MKYKIAKPEDRDATGTEIPVLGEVSNGTA